METDDQPESAAVSHSCRLHNETESSRGPDLPTEILMEIFELAAFASLRNTAAISLVSSWARRLILPYLFCTIVRHRIPNILSMQRINEARHINRDYSSYLTLPEHLGRHVRNLWFDNIQQVLDEFKMLQACPYIEHLAVPSAALGLIYRTCMSTTGGAFPLSHLRQITLLTHLQRYEWQILEAARTSDNKNLVHNITHLHMLDLRISAYIPHDRMPNLTHLALPYLDLGADISHDALRVPSGILEHPSLQMVVLTMNEAKYLDNPWYHVLRLTTTDRLEYKSPRESLKALMQQAREKDERIKILLSPRRGEDPCGEWKTSASGGKSIWEKASQAMIDEAYTLQLPAVYPRLRGL